jgi:hypothetical protein
VTKAPATRKKASKPKAAKKTGQRPVLQFRVHEALYEQLKLDAAANRTSISEEAYNQLSKAVGDRDIFPGIQRLAMLASSAFWHFGQKANQFEGYSSTDWMKDPRCYREAWIAAAQTLLAGMPGSDDPTTRAEAVAALAKAVTKERD